MTRQRTRLLHLFALTLVLVVGVETIPGALGHDQAALLSEIVVSNGSRAASWVQPLAHEHSGQPCANLASRFGVPNHLLQNLPFGFYASIWPSYQALNALNVTSWSAASDACTSVMESTIQAIDDNYWDESLPNLPGAFDQGPATFHSRSDLPRLDDSLWMGLAIEQEYGRTKYPTLLHRAELIFRLATSNWAPQGGIYWEVTGRNNPSEAVVSNAPAVVLGIELFRETGNRNDLVWSERIMSWLSAHLRDPGSGLYDDSLTHHAGRTVLNRSVYTYNQGMVVGALAMLSSADPAMYPMSGAVELAERSLSYFGRHHSYGLPGFDVIWVENLLWTASADHSAVLEEQADQAVHAAIAAEPQGHQDLLTLSSELALHELTQLPASRDAQLLYVARA